MEEIIIVDGGVEIPRSDNQETIILKEGESNE